MAKRNRVPRRKQLGSHKRDRNVNPKLSPYQKEQKRDRMANQPPVNRIVRDFPASARKLQKFLDQQTERRGEFQKRSATTSTKRTDAPILASDNTRGHEENLNAALVIDALPASENPAVRQLEKKMLHAQKKKLKRKEARIEQLHRESDRLEALLQGKNTNTAAQMKSTRRKKNAVPREPAAVEQSAPQSEIEPPEPQAMPAAVTPRNTKDFDDLIDVVRFGDRNDAPPTLDVRPKLDHSLIPRHHVGKVKRQQLVEQTKRAKLQGILGTSYSTTSLPDGSELVSPKVRGTRLESAQDFEKLRERVMARYAAKNQFSFFQRRRNTTFEVAEGDEVEN